VDGADAKRFTLKKGNKLTFKATAFKAQSNTYRVKIKDQNQNLNYLIRLISEKRFFVK
jgi:hypothetical protein